MTVENAAAVPENQAPGIAVTPPSPEPAQTDELVVDGAYAERPLTVKYKDKKTGKEVTDKFLLREVGGKDRSKMIAHLRSQMEYDMSGAEPRLVALKETEDSDVKTIGFCLYDEIGRARIPEEEYAGKWPGRTLNTVAAACIKLCGLDKNAGEREKNS